MHTPNDEMKTKRYKFSPVSEFDFEESYFLNAKLETPHQQV